MTITPVCKKCNDVFLEALEKDPHLDRPAYERYPDADFDDTTAWKCSGCDHVLELEIDGPRVRS